MFKFAAFGGDDKDSPEIAAAIAKQFRSRKPTLMRRLQYYKENRKWLDVYSEIKDIKFYLEIMKDELMVETHGVSHDRKFLSKTYHMDSKHPIPKNWKSKTSFAPCRYAYDPSLERDPEKREGFEMYKKTGEKWGEPAQFPSRMSQKDMYNSPRRYQHANQNRGRSRKRRQSRHPAATGRYQGAPHTFCQSSSRPRAASPYQDSAGGESVPRPCSVHREPPRQQFPSISTSFNVPLRVELEMSYNPTRMFMLHVTNQNSITNINGPPLSLNPPENYNISGNAAPGQSPSQRHFRMTFEII